MRPSRASGPARAAAWLFALAVLAGLVLRPWYGDGLYVTRYTGYVMPWLLLGLVPAAGWAWWMRSRKLSAVLLASAAVVVASNLSVVRTRRPQSFPTAGRLVVMSYNTWSRNDDAARIADVVACRDPDVLLVQEIRTQVFEELVHRLRNRRGPLHYAYEPETMQGLVTRYPIESRASLAWGQAQRVVLRSPFGAVVVFNVHPLRTGGWRRRYDEIAALLEEDVLREDGPVILGGDLNAGEHSQVYQLLSEHLTDAHWATGSGFGFTYPASGFRRLTHLPVPPLVRIDHVFFSRHFVALRAGTLDDSGGSDHLPVYAELAPRWVAPAATGALRIGPASRKGPRPGGRRRSPHGSPARGQGASRPSGSGGLACFAWGAAPARPGDHTLGAAAFWGAEVGEDRRARGGLPGRCNRAAPPRSHDEEARC